MDLAKVYDHLHEYYFKPQRWTDFAIVDSDKTGRTVRGEDKFGNQLLIHLHPVGHDNSAVYQWWLILPKRAWTRIMTGAIPTNYIELEMVVGQYDEDVWWSVLYDDRELAKIGEHHIHWLMEGRAGRMAPETLKPALYLPYVDRLQLSLFVDDKPWSDPDTNAGKALVRELELAGKPNSRLLREQVRAVEAEARAG